MTLALYLLVLDYAAGSLQLQVLQPNSKLLEGESRQPSEEDTSNKNFGEVRCWGVWVLVHEEQVGGGGGKMFTCWWAGGGKVASGWEDGLAGVSWPVR